MLVGFRGPTQVQGTPYVVSTWEPSVPLATTFYTLVWTPFRARARKEVASTYKYHFWPLYVVVPVQFFFHQAHFVASVTV